MISEQLRAMTISKAREFLSKDDRMKYILDCDDANELKTTKIYTFKLDCGHTFNSYITNVLYRDNKLHCPICSGNRVLKGYNDLWTTRPDLAKNLKNASDGYLYSKGSNKILEWVCPTCGKVYKHSPATLTTDGHFICNLCHNKSSYGERYLVSVLEQLNIPFSKEVYFPWGGLRRYDFFIASFNLIIEVHGKQHYEGQFWNTPTIMFNDDEKRELAIKHQVSKEHYIELDFTHPENAREIILGSDLPYILYFFDFDVDWKLCELEAHENVDILICEEFNNGVDVKTLSNRYSYSISSIWDKLQWGKKLGIIPNYDKVIKDSFKKAQQKSCGRKICQYDLSGNLIKVYDSAGDANKVSLHAYDCARGWRKTSGGYIWKFLDNNENKIRFQ